MESADYANLGCHFICVTPIGGKTRLAVTWVLGNCAGDESFARIFDAHLGGSGDL